MSEAWEFFGPGNGVDRLAEMRTRVGQYRRQPIQPGDDPHIGCIVIRDTRFFPAEDTADPPPRFAPAIVHGKSYDLAHDASGPYFQDPLDRLLGSTVAIDLSEPWNRPGPVYGGPRLASQRLGQRAFQAVVLRAYSRRCASPAKRSAQCCRRHTS